MTKITHYKAGVHRGYLPVRVLPYNFAEWFFNISPDFKDEFNFEVISNNLQDKLSINIQKSKITDFAYVDKINGIVVYENFNQYLWCICYSIFVIFDEGIQKPSINGSFNGIIDMTNILTKRAFDLFSHSFSLFDNFNSDNFYTLPNPEVYDEKEQYYVERANGIYSAAMVFVLLHEFGHQYYGHNTYYPNNEQSKDEEYLADDFAYDKMAEHFYLTEGTTYKFGIIAAIGSLILSDNSAKGGDRHPDPDQRLLRQIEKMKLDEINNLWGVSSVLLYLWEKKYSKKVSDSYVFDNYKEMFYHILCKINEEKNNY